MAGELGVMRIGTEAEAKRIPKQEPIYDTGW